MIRLLPAIAMVAVLLQETVENPYFKNWSKFKAGTKVTVKTEEESKGGKTEMATVVELKSVGEREVVLSISGSMTVMGRKIDMPAREQSVTSTMAKEPVDESVKVESGEETVEVAGKSYRCRWEKRSTSKGWEKRWLSDDLPGLLVKAEQEGEGRTMRQQVTAIEVK